MEEGSKGGREEGRKGVQEEENKGGKEDVQEQEENMDVGETERW
jgi:hypothetical protein